MLFTELLYTLKILRKNYLFTLLCTSVLAVGVGIVLPLYVLVQNLALKTPDFPEGDRFIAFSKDESNLSKYDAFHYNYFRQNSTKFAELYAWSTANFTISDGEYAEVFKSAAVEPALLQMPQVQPQLGRMLTDADTEQGASPVAIISHDAWQSYYAAREDIIGHRSRINGQQRTIVGVMPPGFRFPFAQDLWLPLRVPAAANAAEGPEDLLIVGKLKADVTLREASDDVALLQQSLLVSWPGLYREGTSSAVVPYVRILDNLGVNSFALVVVFGSLLLLVALNESNLFLARSEERIAELSVRSALGATAGRVAWALLLESFVVCCLGLACGWVLSYFALDWIAASYEAQGTFNNTRYSQLFWWDMSLDGELLLASAAGVLIVWLLSGGLPAWRLARSSPGELLAGSGKGSGYSGVTRTSKILVNVQLVLGCVLLTLSTIQTIVILGSAQTRTTDAERIFVGNIVLTGNKLVGHPEQLQYFTDLENAIVGQPGVQDVAFASVPPAGGGARLNYAVEGQAPVVGNANQARLWSVTVSAGYFDFFGYELLEGRNFSAADDAAAQPVIIIDQRLAEQHWPNGGALGKRLQLNPSVDASWYTVVGVSTSHTQEDFLEPGQQARPVVYRPVTQVVSGGMQAMVRVNSAQLTPLRLFREAATAVDRDIPISDTMTLRDTEVRYAEGQKVSRNLFVAFILISFYIAGIATYGLAARIAGRRKTETGIRMAVGASRRAAMQVFIKDGFTTVLTGLALGIAGAIVLSYVIMQSINTVGTFSLLVPSAIIIGLSLGAMVMLANYIPARKLVVMEPAEALRHE